jgi:two-component system response regulator ChvI
MKVEANDGATHTRDTHVLVVEDDPFFRETMTSNLQDAGFTVTAFDCGEAAVQYLQEGGEADLALLDWKLPTISGIELFRRLREHRADIPFIFVTSLSDQVYEEAALMNGAVDFVDKTRSFSILLSRIETVLKGRKGSHAPRSSLTVPPLRCGDLEMDLQSHRAIWKGKQVNLTFTEFKIVHHLASQTRSEVPHREIYDLVRAPGFLVGDGENGYRSNVRTFIKRIRRKFRAIDGEFDGIVAIAGVGYRWIGNSAALAEDTPVVPGSIPGSFAG